MRMRSLGLIVALVAGCGFEPLSGNKMAPWGPGDDESADSSPSARGGGDGDVQPSTLTAGAWDDNLNFDYYRAYLARTEAQQLAGLPSVPRADRVLLRVRDGDGRPLAGAQLVVRRPDVDGGAELMRAATGAEGTAWFLPAWDGVRAGEPVVVEAEALGVQGSARLTVGGATAVDVTVEVHAGLPRQLDVALVVDATGSMGDELAWLAAEFDAIAARVESAYPGVSQRWALVSYRDESDLYVTRSTDFADDRAGFRAALKAQRAEGGGDYPEAVPQALEAAAKLGWRGGATARLAFHVADAPAHAGDAQRVAQAVRALRAKGVHIYPVAASGTDEVAEFTMRTEAQVTGGRYLFLTDDSGVGGAHKEPTIPCYFVTKLDVAMLRMIDTEMTGVRREPAAAEIIRTGGDPTDGACLLDDGQRVQVF